MMRIFKLRLKGGGVKWVKAISISQARKKVKNKGLQGVLIDFGMFNGSIEQKLNYETI